LEYSVFKGLNDFFATSDKFYLKRKTVNGSLYHKKLELFGELPDNHIIVIDNTQFPKPKLNHDVFFWGSYQTSPINIDVTVTSELTFKTSYFIFFIICKIFI